MEDSDLFSVIQACKDCKGVGKKLEGKKVVNCHCVEKALLDYRLSVSNIPPRLKKFEFRDYIFKNSPTFQKVQKYVIEVSSAVEKGVGMYLHGSETDTNMLAIGALKELMKSGYMGYYIPYASCMSSWSTGQESQALNERFTFVCIANITSVLDNLTNFKPAVLTGANTNPAVTYLEQILSFRASFNLPTILTGTVGPEILTNKFPSLGTIIYGNFLSVPCVENDFRGKRAYAKLESEFGFDTIQ